MGLSDINSINIISYVVGATTPLHGSFLGKFAMGRDSHKVFWVGALVDTQSARYGKRPKLVSIQFSFSCLFLC